MRTICLLLLIAGLAQAAPETPRVTAAAQPLAEGVPQVAVVRLRALLTGTLSPDEKHAANAKLGEALVAAERYDEALEALKTVAREESLEIKFFRAQALAGLSRWAEALPLYRAVAAESGARFQSDAIFGAGETLRALGRLDESLQTLALLEGVDRWRTQAHSRMAEVLLLKNDPEGAKRALDAVEATAVIDRKERRFLRGCAELKLGKNQRAATHFASVLKNPQGATHSVLIASLLGVAEANLRAAKPGRANDYLEDFIERYPTDPDLPAVFAKVDQLYAVERKQSRHELGRWSRESSQPRRALAQWYLARAELRLGRRDNALRAFAQLLSEQPRSPLLAPAFLESAQLLLEERRFDQAIAALDAARALQPPAEIRERIEMLAGRIHVAAQQFDLAGETFQQVALSPGEHAQDARFNASLAWLSAGDESKANAARDALRKGGANETARGELSLEEALVQARRGEKTAAESLQNFVRAFPKHPRISEAWVALAELAFHQSRPQLDDARRNLQRAIESQPTAAAQERADYLLIWIEETAAPNENKIIELTTQFLQKHPQSAFAADVRLKLAETYYARQDFASAQTQFALLAQQDANAPIAERAQFFAAQSARQMMGTGSVDTALKLFDQVVKRNGELKWAARNEQAVIERKLGKPEDALTLYEEVLKGDAKGPEKREALCGKADILYEMGAENPENYKRALELYQQLAGQGEVGSHWRNQALFKKGMCQEKLNAPEQALATFYEIVEDGSRPDRRREFFWFYKAGFNAARLLEEQSKWEPAAAIYEKLAFAGGARSEEAKSRLNRLRLEHFLWEQ